MQWIRRRSFRAVYGPSVRLSALRGRRSVIIGEHVLSREGLQLLLIKKVALDLDLGVLNYRKEYLFLFTHYFVLLVVVFSLPFLTKKLNMLTVRSHSVFFIVACAETKLDSLPLIATQFLFAFLNWRLSYCFAMFLIWTTNYMHESNEQWKKEKISVCTCFLRDLSGPLSLFAQSPLFALLAIEIFEPPPCSAHMLMLCFRYVYDEPNVFRHRYLIIIKYLWSYISSIWRTLKRPLGINTFKRRCLSSYRAEIRTGKGVLAGAGGHNMTRSRIRNRHRSWLAINMHISVVYMYMRVCATRRRRL